MSMTVYSHDGIRDSLTHLAAPPLLYEALRRELARAMRQNEPISLIRFLLVPGGLHLHNSQTASAEFEMELISFAHSLALHSRREDLCARMGEFEFVCVLHGLEEASENFATRIFLRWQQVKSTRTQSQQSEDLSLEVASLVSKPSESAMDFLNRLDLEPTIAR